MMQIVTLEEIKANSRIDYNDEDTLLEMYRQSAEETLKSILDRTWEDVIDEYGEIPTPIRHAVLMLVEHWHVHRGPIGPTALYNVPYTIDFLVKPYIKLV